jgi:hypothetical protein
MNTNYSPYINFVKQIVDADDLAFFKCHPDYRTTLEHVTEKEGLEYLKEIYEKTSLDNSEILEFCTKNDRIGNPIKANIDSFHVSPSSLRYIFHAHIILSYLKKLNNLECNIVEIGGGYGGLCLSMFHFAKRYGIKINSYTIIDLEYPSKLQEKYLALQDVSLPVKFIEASTFGKTIEGNNYFLLSNYCFSEINDYFQKEYIKHLFPKVEHGFMAWNGIPLYNFGFEINYEEEYPKTGGLNKYVYF